MQDFVNSKSMATPGLIGGLVMFIANSINYQFDLGHGIKWIVLLLSFLAGLVIIADTSKISTVVKIVLYVFNSLIIFCMATGTNSIGQKVIEGSSAPPNPIIKPLSGNASENDRSTFVFASYQNQDTLKNKSVVRKSALKTHAIAISNAIQMAQYELVQNHDDYANPQEKLNTLKTFNDQLEKVHNLVSNDAIITHTDHQKYEVTLNDLHVKVDKFKANLNTKPQAKKFFTDW
jgi:hypothetical protein